MRAIEPPVASEPRPPVAITPTMTMAAIATKAAATRQKVSLRRILRRSTITSESSDIEILLKYAARFAFAASPTAYPITSIAMQYEENKALLSSPRKRGPIATDINLGSRCRLQRSYRKAAEYGSRLKAGTIAVKTKKGPGRNRGPIDGDRKA